MDKIIMHIDVNNAFLSWTAIYLLNHGYKQDIRKIPSVIGGDEKARRGIISKEDWKKIYDNFSNEFDLWKVE